MTVEQMPRFKKNDKGLVITKGDYKDLTNASKKELQAAEIVKNNALEVIDRPWWAVNAYDDLPYGIFHYGVQDNIRKNKNNKGIKENELYLKYNDGTDARADIWLDMELSKNKHTIYLWEVKPHSYLKNPNKEKGEKQLNQYIGTDKDSKEKVDTSKLSPITNYTFKNGNELAIKDEESGEIEQYIKNGEFYFDIKVDHPWSNVIEYVRYDVTYECKDNGLIIYDFQRILKDVEHRDESSSEEENSQAKENPDENAKPNENFATDAGDMPGVNWKPQEQEIPTGNNGYNEEGIPVEENGNTGAADGKTQTEEGGNTETGNKNSGRNGRSDPYDEDGDEQYDKNRDGIGHSHGGEYGRNEDKVAAICKYSIPVVVTLATFALAIKVVTSKNPYPNTVISAVGVICGKFISALAGLKLISISGGVITAEADANEQMNNNAEEINNAVDEFLDSIGVLIGEEFAENLKEAALNEDLDTDKMVNSALKELYKPTAGDSNSSVSNDPDSSNSSNSSTAENTNHNNNAGNNNAGNNNNNNNTGNNNNGGYTYDQPYTPPTNPTYSTPDRSSSSRRESSSRPDSSSRPNSSSSSRRDDTSSQRDSSSSRPDDTSSQKESSSSRYEDSSSKSDEEEAMSSENEEVDSASETKYDPLILDVDNDGYDIDTKEEGTHFDLNCDDFAEKINWTRKDGILAIDKNGNGKIDNGREVFGDTFVLDDGSYAANGFEALKQYDSNGDNLIDKNDDVFSKLYLWLDSDGNGKSEPNELRTLREKEITKIDLNYITVNELTGSEAVIGNESYFEYSNGVICRIGEMWVSSNLYDALEIIVAEPNEEIAGLPNVRSFGKVHSLHTAMMLDKPVYCGSLYMILQTKQIMTRG